VEGFDICLFKDYISKLKSSDLNTDSRFLTSHNCISLINDLLLLLANCIVCEENLANDTVIGGIESYKSEKWSRFFL